MANLKRLKAKRWARQRKLSNDPAMLVLLVIAAWQGFVNSPIEQITWSLPK